MLVAVFAMVAGACQTGGGETTTTAAGGEETTTTTAAGGEETTTSIGGSAEGFTYRLGIFQDTTTDNFWAYYDPASTVWNQYVLAVTKPALYAINMPGIEVDSDIAASPEVPTGAAEGDGWAIEVAMRDDATWSDGTPITANDIVFTYETVRDFALGGSWLEAYPIADPENPEAIGLTGVEAVDDYTVKFIFNAQPGLAVWPHGVGIAPIMPQHVWGTAVEEAAASDDSAAALYGTAGTGLDVSGGPMVFAERQEGAFARNTANSDFYDTGREITSGDATYTVGPYATEAVFSLYGGQDAAVLALKAGEVDYLLNPLGMQRGLLSQVEGDANLTAVVNPTNGFRYLAFNLRKEPFSIPQFRDALALMIDKEFMANNVLQGVAFPLYATVPEGNTKWYNEEAADAMAAQYVGKPTADRLSEAIALLKEAGFAWEVEPTMDEAGVTVNAGSGITLNGAPVDQIEILAPGPGYDPLRATYSIWIETWLNQLGFDAEANPTDFNAIVDKVYTPTESGELDFDMFILGWSLGNPALPTYHGSFFYGPNDTLLNEGNNAPGFHNDEFDALVDQFNAAQSEEEAYDLIWQMEDILAREKPYILLFDTGILEFYRQANVNFPFTSTLSGLQFISGSQGLVTAAK
ncbi:MAG TPA: ABC transporter substrate-binding protein [Acidimicrobiia bacterium]|nr:ABC transporter substrate-binding protein [Acidimicrobiia bacterium]